jgi:hypothetical protein
VLEQALVPGLDAHVFARFEAMVERYSGYIARERARATS